ncbi:MAG: T9SS type A sorting domain-containing protein, partial [Bacteroidota bacterium]
QWSTSPPQTTPTATDLAAGMYNVLITYGDNCEILTETITVGSNVSIEDEIAAGISSLDAFPNPTASQLSVNIELEKVDNVNVRLYDLNGKAVFQDSRQNVRAYNRDLSVESLPAGVYLLEVQTSRGSATERVVVL